MNIHEKTKTGFEYVVKYFRYNYPGSPFNEQIIEIFNGPNYENGKVCPKPTEIKVERGDY